VVSSSTFLSSAPPELFVSGDFAAALAGALAGVEALAGAAALAGVVAAFFAGVVDLAGAAAVFLMPVDAPPDAFLLSGYIIIL